MDEDNASFRSDTLKGRFSVLFNKDYLSDVQFIVGIDSGTRRFPAHKLVLSTGSSVFNTMFYGSLPETSGVIDVPDVEPAAFLQLLRFLYMDISDVHISDENVLGTLYVARKYDVSALEECCVTHLLKNMCLANIFTILAKAEFFELPVLKKECFEFIDRKAEAVFREKGFVDVDSKTLCSILERDTLNISEIYVFCAVEKWAIAECYRKELDPEPANLRSVLTDVFKLIRFPVMSLQEFTTRVTSTGILSDSEELSLLRYYTHAYRPKTEFSDKPRGLVTSSGREWMKMVLENASIATRPTFCVRRFRHHTSSAENASPNGINRISFTVNRSIRLVGCRLFVWNLDLGNERDVTIRLVHSETNNLLAKNRTGIVKQNNSKKFRILFEEPVLIRPEVKYTCIYYMGAACAYRGVEAVYNASIRTSVGEVNFEFFDPLDFQTGEMKEGQIPELLFEVV